MQKRGIQIDPPELPDHDFTIDGDEFGGDDLEFEIRFFEGVLESCPDHLESLTFLGQFYTTRGDYARGLEIDLRLARLRPRDPIVHYNLACSYSLLGRIDEALRALERSVQLGYSGLAHLLADDDLDNVRRDARFARVMQMLEAAGRQ